jgi:hypothetical protein
MKKFLAVLLAVLMAFSAMSVVGYAADATTNDTTTEEEDNSPAIVKTFKTLFEDLDDKITIGELASSDFTTALRFVAIFPLLSLVEGLILIVFTVLNFLGMDIKELLAQFGVNISF